eukprot:479280_1
MSSGNECLNTSEEEWTKWHIENPFSFKKATTAIIKWRESCKQYETSITTKKYKYSSMWDSDDESEQAPEIIVTDYTFNRMDICVIPQIGTRAGIPQKWTYNKPGELEYHTDSSPTPNIYVTTESVPSRDDLISSVLRYVHDLNTIDDNGCKMSLRSQLSPISIQTPIQLNDHFLCYCFQIPHQIIGQIILKYLGVMQISIDFIPNHVFKPLTINVVDAMRADEIKSLVITTLFIKYPNLQSVPLFLWNYDCKGIDLYSKRRNRGRLCFSDIFSVQRDAKHTAVLENIALDHFGLCNANESKTCVVLNMVGYGYKTIYCDFKQIRFQALVDEFYNFTKQSKENMDNEIIAIYPNSTSKSNESNLLSVFHPRTRYRYKDAVTVFPDEQSKTFMTFEHEKYKALLNKTLFELNLDMNGNLIEMYCVTGPCIPVCFASMVGDSRVMDVNFNWSIEVFKMYAAKFGHGKSFSIEHLNKDQKTIGDVCAALTKRRRTFRVVCRY